MYSMKTELTNEDVTAYVESNGILCPYCGGNEMTCDSDFPETGGMNARVSCDECGAVFAETYKLVGMDTIRGPRNLVVTSG
jgi:uncharacterized Zn finger protein